MGKVVFCSDEHHYFATHRNNNVTNLGNEGNHFLEMHYTLQGNSTLGDSFSGK